MYFKGISGKTIVVTDPAGNDRELTLSELRFVRLWEDMPF